ncbi:BZ3500_MvSof-1268-A1-R1_Chr12-1g03661 [Microbotryum saponariae]|uniref:BZ3500_MvSof-1268-A1-R1_Chr12-1g03661 protein n=1 Tax=Microbotryum saponariae TaxID=289078 RepID=A0A2X0KM15_9BASI|nr:BZ3500_MvSof-1268-A1-R1_Chr12-1g03661 [Microbotryum saponariae]SDA05254.1 BZ3501_MvSof-1269-A2-R1_Chr12-1g03238 [Microbotryum saponariae]
MTGFTKSSENEKSATKVAADRHSTNYDVSRSSSDSHTLAGAARPDKYEKGAIPTYGGLTGDKLIWAITASASCGFGLFGYDQGVMSGIISAPQFFRVLPTLNPEVSGDYQASVLQAFIVAIYEIGCLAGAIFALCYGDRLGRRKMMVTSAAIMCIGVILQITTMKNHSAFAQFTIGRIVTGLGNGMNTATIPTWHAETAKAHNRGLLICIEASMISTGTAISYWIDLGFSYIDNSISWRTPIGLQMVFAVGLVVSVAFLPESPRWLLANGQQEEGQRVIAALEPAPIESELFVSQTKVIIDSLEGSVQPKKKDVLNNGPTQHLRRALLGASSQIMQQIGGCNAVIYFAPVIFQQNLHLSRELSLILGGVNVTVYALSSGIAFYTIERVGRRILFLVGSAGQAFSMFIIMGFLIPGNDNLIKGSVFGIFLYLAFFGFTWLQLPWIYPAEVNPLATRTNANALSTICNWLFNFAVVMWTPPMLTAINWGTFLFFGVLNVLFIPFIWVFYPETAGRTLEEIDCIFARAYVEKQSYVKVAAEMPKLTDAEIENEWRRLGLTGEVEGPRGLEDARDLPSVV